MSAYAAEQRVRWWEPWLVAAAVLLGLLGLDAAAGRPGLTWDEPPDISRQRLLETWLSRAATDDGFRPLAESTLRRYFPFCRPAPHEHPPVYAWLGVATHAAFGFLGELAARRLATQLCFAALAAGLYLGVGRCWGRFGGVVAVLTVACQPRLLTHADLVTLDVPVACFVLWTLVVATRSAFTGRHAWLFGVLAGTAVMTKATGVLVLPAVALWCVVVRPPFGWRLWRWAIPTLPLAVLTGMPPWWTDPVFGPLRWADALRHYDQRVPVYWLGTLHDYRTSLPPWASVWLTMLWTTPPALVALVLAGLGVRLARLRDRGEACARWALADASAVMLALYLTLRMVGLLPGHDGIRQLVPVMPLWGVPAGAGAAALRRRVSGRLGRGLLTGLVAAALLTAAATTARTWPYGLSYYGVLVGGTPGAAAAGLDATYYWDAATDGFVERLDAVLPPGSDLIVLPPPDVRVFDFHRQWGRLRPDVVVHGSYESLAEVLNRTMADGRPVHAVVQNRGGLLYPRGPDEPTFAGLLWRQRPVLEVRPPAVGVRLVAVFDRAAILAAMRALSASALPDRHPRTVP